LYHAICQASHSAHRPRLLVAVVAIASSIGFALVVGIPPKMIAYATSYFQAQDMFKRGAVLELWLFVNFRPSCSKRAG